MYSFPNSTPKNRSRDNVVNHFSPHIRQPHVAAGEAEGKPRVIEAEQIEHRGVQVVNLELVFNHLVAELVGLAIDGAALDASAGHPEGEPKLIVIAAI